MYIDYRQDITTKYITVIVWKKNKLKYYFMLFIMKKKYIIQIEFIQC